MKFNTQYAPALAGLMDMHSESVTYTPKGLVATAINAIVIRDPIAQFGPDGSVTQYPCEIIIGKAAFEANWTGASPNCNGDTVAIKRRVSDAATTTFSVSALLGGQGADVWYLGLNA